MVSPLWQCNGDYSFYLSYRPLFNKAIYRLFGPAIDWDLIARDVPDMLRVA